ncbi:PAS domain-containing protein [Sphingomonas nostoxanthinifaciens]|uniref:PAS domain-containing protein n=1 Tax=Sphingomonas nostoxanthinifaciens TaxID=2872652 RepID=UPI001CC1CBC4|nr:PAS domain-containing protein [Sphingomonas nostoxanthinifaciens]UAK22957.1 PAS domain-containing protein [Sphingomonas nostoxanthinifaciens]
MSVETPRTRVTAAEFVRRFGCWQEEAVQRPVYVTHHGRDRLVMLSVASYQSLRGRSTGEASQRPPLEPMLEHMTEGFFAVDQAFRLVEINAVAAGYFRLVRGAALGLRLADEVSRLDGSLLMGHLMRAVAAGEMANFSTPSPCYSGRVLHLRVFPHGDGAACLMRDITEEIEGQRRCDADAAGMAALTIHGGVGRARLSARGTFVEVDEALAGMAGFASQMLVRARLVDVLPLDRRVAASSELEAVMSGGGARAFDTALLVNRGDELPVRIALAAQYGERDGDGAVVLVSRR